MCPGNSLIAQIIISLIIGPYGRNILEARNDNLPFLPPCTFPGKVYNESNDFPKEGVSN